MPVKQQSGRRWQMSTQTRFPSPMLSLQTISRFFCPLRWRAYKLCVQIANQQDTMGPVDNEAGSASLETVPRPRKRPRRTGEVQKAADRDSREARIARRAQVKQRFVKHREKHQKTGRWAEPRKFEAWLEWLAEREMDNVGEADAAAIPSASCMPQVVCLSTMCV